MHFTKMHGAGNDYIYVDCFARPAPESLGELAVRVSDRRFGIGADGLILILPSETADARMRIFNADGSEAEMCGNGLRCLAKYVYDHGLCRNPQMRIETGAGTLPVELLFESGTVRQVVTDLGPPELEAARIPTRLEGSPVVNRSLSVNGTTLQVTSVSMGNPHCVVFVPQATDELVLGLGPRIEHHADFPQRTNVEFVEVTSSEEVRQRTWERGSGETWACGTGAAAVCVAGALTGRTGRRILNHVRGGDLKIEWNEQNDHVLLTGPAEEVYSGQWPEG